MYVFDVLTTALDTHDNLPRVCHHRGEFLVVVIIPRVRVMVPLAARGGVWPGYRIRDVTHIQNGQSAIVRDIYVARTSPLASNNIFALNDESCRA